MASTLESTTAPAETADVVVDYSLPLDKMTPAQREAAIAHGIEDTKKHIAAERLQVRNNHEGVIGTIIHTAQ